MALPRPASPRTLWADLRAFAAGRDRTKLMLGLLAAMMPMIIVYGFMRDTRGLAPKGLKIIYVEGWRADRSDEVIKKEQIADQKLRDAAKLERQRSYQRLAKQLGIE
jgi:hypothetical protein